MRKCGFCRKSSNKLNQCWILKEGLHGYGADPDYYMVIKSISLYLCDKCSVKSYALRHVGVKFEPFILKEDYFKK